MERLTYKDSTLPRATEHGELIRAYSDYNPRTIINKLSEYEDLEEQGRLVVLPCKVGETVWFIRGGWENGILMRRHPHEIVPVPFDPSKMWDFENNQFKPHYHLTSAEAEKAMEVSG